MILLRLIRLFLSLKECGKVLKSYSGYVFHPNYPKQYKNRVNCLWTIVAPAGKKVNLEFKHFKFEISSGCQNDYIEVYDGSDTTAPRIGRFCGQDVPEPIVSTANFLSIVMVTNDEVTARGFIVLYKQVDDTDTNQGSGRGNNNNNKSRIEFISNISVIKETYFWNLLFKFKNLIVSLYASLCFYWYTFLEMVNLLALGPGKAGRYK